MDNSKQQQQQQHNNHVSIYPKSSIKSHSFSIPLISSGEGDKKPTLIPTKAAAAMVHQWLKENFEFAEASSLARSAVYQHYVAFCKQLHLSTVNAASFGKLIRSVFPGLKTRRLGTRGNSKYHYYGVRVKPTSKLLVQIPPLESTSASTDSKSTHSIDSSESKKVSVPDLASIGFYTPSPASYFSSHPPTLELPEFNAPNADKLPSDVKVEQYKAFMAMYRTHCQRLLNNAANHNFADVEKLLVHFWMEMPSHIRAVIGCDVVVQEVAEKDHVVYSMILHALLPNVLETLPVTVPQTIRDFTKMFCTWMGYAMEGLPRNLADTKLKVAGTFAYTLRKQAALNHLAQAARAILQNPNQISQMHIDWHRIDFEAIQHRSHWLCAAGQDMISIVQADFAHFLERRCTVEQWARWLEGIVIRFHEKCETLSQIMVTSQQLLVKWSYYSSLIIRDLTIRNARSFGCFHLMRTLFDEYLHYLVEKQLTEFMEPSEDFVPTMVSSCTSTPPRDVDGGRGSPSPSPSSSQPLERRQSLTTEETGGLGMRKESIDSLLNPKGLGDKKDVVGFLAPGTRLSEDVAGFVAPSTRLSDEASLFSRRRPSFGSFGSFSSEFSKALFPRGLGSSDFLYDASTSLNDQTSSRYSFDGRTSQDLSFLTDLDFSRPEHKRRRSSLLSFSGLGPGLGTNGTLNWPLAASSSSVESVNSSGQ